MAGIEQNPGPNWNCSVCRQQINKNTISVQCNLCLNWCHMKKCTNLKSHNQWSTSFAGDCCKVQTNIPSQYQSANPVSSLNRHVSNSSNQSIPSAITWKCSICKLQIKNNSVSVKCNCCSNWCHLRCTNLKSHYHWTTTFTANCCQHQTNVSVSNDVGNVVQGNASNTHLIQKHNNSNNNDDTNTMGCFKILQFNCNSLTKKLDEIDHSVHGNK